MPRPGGSPPLGGTIGANGSNCGLSSAAGNPAYGSSSPAFEEALDAAIDACRTTLQVSFDRELAILRGSLLQQDTSSWVKVNGATSLGNSAGNGTCINGPGFLAAAAAGNCAENVMMTVSSAQDDEVFQTCQTSKSAVSSQLAFDEDVYNRMRQEIEASLRKDQPQPQAEQQGCLSCGGNGCSLCGLGDFIDPDDLPHDPSDNHEVQGAKLNIMKTNNKKTKRVASEMFVATNSLQTFVHHHAFEWTCTCVILLNTLYMGAHVDGQVRHAIKHRGSGPPPNTVFNSLDYGFLCFYTVEVGLKLLAFRKEFFTKHHEWEWNVFDLTLVVSSWGGMMLPDKILNPSFLRIARIFKQVAKAMRVINVVRFFEELRVIMAAFAGSLMTFLWAMVSLIVILYIFCIVFLDGVSVMLQDSDVGNIDEQTLNAAEDLWGSLGKAMLTLGQCITGGRPWYTALDPLSEAGWFYSIIFLVYIAFLAIAMLRLLTGLFVGKANKAAVRDHEEAVWTHLRELFEAVDSDGSGQITKDEFVTHLDDRNATEVLSMLNIDKQHAITLFQLLDASGDGKLDVEEFLLGCAHFGGMAKNIELALVNCKMSDLYRQITLLIDYLEISTQLILKAVKRDHKHSHKCKRLKSNVFEM